MSLSNFYGNLNINIQNTAFFLCDIQEKFRSVINHFDDIVEVSRRLIEASRILNIPLIVTEQYPKGLGSTVKELNIEHASIKAEKTKFSMYIDPVTEYLKTCPNIKNIVLFGIETHVCIQQTMSDLLENNYQVHIIVDATSSRNHMDRLFAIKRFQQLGAFVTTSEALLMQLIGDKNHNAFKEIQSLIKSLAPTSGLLASNFIL